MSVTESFTAFNGHRQIATGELLHVAQAALSETNNGDVTILILDDLTASPVELDLRHSAEQAVAGYRARTHLPEAVTIRPGRGRPKLGVIAREVTLLPRHWDWLSGQPGGASAALRRLVEDARRTSEGPDRVRKGQQCLYRAMSILAGDLPNFEEASRALFANDAPHLTTIVEDWPDDIAAYLRRLLQSYLA
jgi:uncharacterized protein